MSDKSPEIARLTPRRWILIGLAVILALFGIGGVWSWLARLEGAVIATGAVNPESGIKTVQHPDGGVVQEIRVREGDFVRKGDILLVLEDEELRANLQITRDALDSALAEIARLQAERDGRSSIRFPDELLMRSEQTAGLMRTQQQLFLARRRALTGQKEELKRKIRALELQTRGLKAELEGTEEQIALLEEQVKTVGNELKEGRATRPRYLDLKARLARMKGQRGRLINEMARAGEQIAEIRLQLIRIDQVFLSNVLEQLTQRMRDADSLREKLAALEKKLEATKIRAPVDGKVLNLAIRTIGGVVMPGNPIMQIVPVNEPLIVDAKVRLQDIDQVQAGKTARVMITAFHVRDTPSLNGRVRTVSPAPVETELPDGTKAFLYGVEIVVPPEELKRLGDNRQLVPGMPAEVFITTQARRPLDMLLDPLIAAARRSLREG